MLLDPTGLLFWPRLRLLAVADLHLEKGSAAAARGSLVPPWDSSTTLDRLEAGVARHRPDLLVAVGDSFHDLEGAVRMAAADRVRLERIGRGCRLVWVAGNHDPRPLRGIVDSGGDSGGGGGGGAWFEEWRAGPVLFRHEARPHLPPPHGVVEICGHHHPRASVPTRGGGVTRPCFVACATRGRLMLPAFGAYAGGLDVADPAIARLFPNGGRVFLTGRSRLFGFDFHARAAA